MCDLQLSASVAGAIFGRKLHCGVRSRDAADDRDAYSQRGFHIFPSGADRHRGSNPGSWLAIADWISASADDDIRAGHRSFAAA